MAMASPEYLEAADGLRPELGIVSQYVSVGAGNSPAWTGFDSWVNAHPGSDSGEYIEGGDDVIQMYTSSTIGHPKGVVLTHDSLTANIARPSLKSSCPRPPGAGCRVSLSYSGVLYFVHRRDPTQLKL
ncbi:uncharacterized protein METZ01_LOCUS393775 [marine metagenome]|uniref:AMP-dependent synthetase/ligase domain-containing protein n=1 Tax=marine metagenome TaxID=408172 RepID=A0A382V4U0_9ZZZZ